jgi:MFS family permease
VVFLVLGAPGLLLGALMLTVREPARRGVTRSEPAAPLSTFVAHLGQERRAYVGIIAGFALMVMVGNATGAWIPAFFERKFGWSTSEVGARYGLVVFFCGAGGALVGGLIASRLRQKMGARGNLLAALAGFTALIPVTVGFPLVPSADFALTLVGLMNFAAGLNLGGGLAALQELTPNRMRALLSALYVLAINVVGGGLGPLVVALIVDYGFGDPQRLPEALAITAAIASPLAATALIFGMKALPTGRSELSG